MLPALFLVFCLVHVYILYFFLLNNAEWGVCQLILVALEAGLVCDNFLLGLGLFLSSKLGVDLFTTISRVRFLLHGGILPLTFIIEIDLLARIYSVPSWVYLLVVVSSSVLAIHGFYANLRVPLKQTSADGIYRCTPQKPLLENILLAILVTLAGLVVGVIQYYTSNVSTFLIGCIAMLVMSGLPGKGGRYGGNFGEILFCGSLVLQYL